jgi:acyl-CoA ligase (AMP-forming) (exosortase A-associated)
VERALSVSHSQRIEDSLLDLRAEPVRGDLLVDGERRLDHVQLAQWALRFAHELARNGVEPGDRVAIYLDHVAEAIVALYGTWIAGALAVPMNQSLKSPQVAHILRHSGSRVLVSAPHKLALLDEPTLAGVTTLTVATPDSLAGEALAAAFQRTLPGGAAPAALLYTSGSTGRPKGILVSHANLRAGARIVAGYLDLRRDGRILSVLPFSFDYGLNQLLSAVHCGGTLVLQRSHFPADVLRSLAEQRITTLAGVPPFWIQLLRGARRLELPQLRCITNSGGAFPVELVQRCRAELPHVRLYLMYGLSEAFRSTYLAPEELERRPDSIGKAIPECDVLVLDAQNRRCRPGEVGELVHRGPTVALGYWDDPEATARVFRPDPDDARSSRSVVYSGDLVKLDDEGFLSFVGRRDQLIKSYGYRVSPDEVEELIHDSQLVSEVAVHGRPDEVAGAVLVAHVIPADPNAFSTGALLEYCRGQMPAYMVPRVVEVHATLPRTSSGKIDRRALAR